MTQGVYPNVPLNVVSVALAKDSLPTADGEGVPAKYSVLLGLSRKITDYELDEVDKIWSGLTHAYERHWLVVPQTTIDEVEARLPELQAQLPGVEERAGVVKRAVEAIAEGEQAELKRRMGVMTEINRSLEQYRKPPVKET